MQLIFVQDFFGFSAMFLTITIFEAFFFDFLFFHFILITGIHFVAQVVRSSASALFLNDYIML